MFWTVGQTSHFEGIYSFRYDQHVPGKDTLHGALASHVPLCLRIDVETRVKYVPPVYVLQREWADKALPPGGL